MFTLRRSGEGCQPYGQGRLPLKEMDAILQKKIRFFLKELEIVDLFIVFVYLFFYEFCLPLLGLPHHLAERTEVRLF